MPGHLADALPTGTVTFLFTDIEGSTPLWDAHPAEMREALARHDQIIREAIGASGGHVFTTGGDGYGAVFQRAGSAVAAAIGAQRSLTMEPWPEQVALRVRMGVHTGEVQERDGDYFGAPVNRTARLMGAAHGGQVVISALTAELIDDSASVELVDLGSVQLKGVVGPVHVFGATAPGMPWIDRPLVSAQTTAGNLPKPQTEIIGDVAALQHRVSTLGRARLITLTGSGGVGKSRVAIEIGWLVLDEFPDGVWWIELAPIADPEAVIIAVASMLMVQPRPGVPILESIVDWCRDRRLLLIFDNCEHVLGPARALVSAIGVHCQTATILATSREPLRVDGERVIRIPSLEQSYGVELFCARAEAADDSFLPSGEEAAAIGMICDRLDGIPLAIELAAARIRSLSPAELLQHLDDRFRLLGGDSEPGRAERHRTLRTMVTWSYQLLSVRAQLLFDRLSVFANGFTLDAAEAVCVGGAVGADDSIDLIGELVDKSMLLSERSGSTTRYWLLETLRQYGAESLSARGETATVRDRHLAHYRDVAYGIDELWWSPAQLEADAACDREWDNFRAAHNWAIMTGEFRLAVDMLNGTSPHVATNLRFEAADWTSRTIELGDRNNLTDGFLYCAGAYWTLISGDVQQAADFAERGLEISRDEKSVTLNHLWRAHAKMSSGRFDEAVALIPELRSVLATTHQLSNRWFLTGLLIHLLTIENHDAVDEVESYRVISRQIGGPCPLASAQLYYGDLLNFQDAPDVDGAIGTYRDAIRLAIAGRAPLTELLARSALAHSLVMDGRSDEASSALREAFDRSMEARYMPTMFGAVESCAVHCCNLVQIESAATILGFVESHPPSTRASVECRRRTRAAIAGTQNLDSAMAAGAAMSFDDIVAYALERLDAE